MSYRRDVIQHQLDFSEEVKRKRYGYAAPPSPLSVSIMRTNSRKAALLQPIINRNRSDDSVDTKATSRSSKSSRSKNSSGSLPRVMKSPESFGRAMSGFKTDVKRMKKKDFNLPLIQPDWNERFVFGNALGHQRWKQSLFEISAIL